METDRTNPQDRQPGKADTEFILRVSEASVFLPEEKLAFTIITANGDVTLIAPDVQTRRLFLAECRRVLRPQQRHPPPPMSPPHTTAVDGDREEAAETPLHNTGAFPDNRSCVHQNCM